MATGAVDPFIARVHRDIFALMRAGHATAAKQVLGREARTVEGFFAEELSALTVAA